VLNEKVRANIIGRDMGVKALNKPALLNGDS
jgi:hypothetical protein